MKKGISLRMAKLTGKWPVPVRCVVTGASDTAPGTNRQPLWKMGGQCLRKLPLCLSCELDIPSLARPSPVCNCVHEGPA